MEGLDGIERRLSTMRSLRNDPPKTFGGEAVVSVADYLAGTVLSLADGKISETGLPKSDVLTFTLASGARVVVRPSGTEPKIKIYLLVSGKDAASAALAMDAVMQDAKALI